MYKSFFFFYYSLLDNLAIVSYGMLGLILKKKKISKSSSLVTSVPTLSAPRMEFLPLVLYCQCTEFSRYTAISKSEQIN